MNLSKILNILLKLCAQKVYNCINIHITAFVPNFAHIVSEISQLVFESTGKLVVWEPYSIVVCLYLFLCDLMSKCGDFSFFNYNLKHKYSWDLLPEFDLFSNYNFYL